MGDGGTDQYRQVGDRLRGEDGDPQLAFEVGAAVGTVLSGC